MKLDAMLNKISETLATIKKTKHKTLEEQRSTRSDLRSEVSGPTHKSAPSAAGRGSDVGNRQRLDAMKQVELGLIYDRGNSVPQLEEKEYFHDFMSLLVDDRDVSEEPTQKSKLTVTERTNTMEDYQNQHFRPDRHAQQASIQILKQRVSDTVNKAELALKNYRQLRPIGKMKNPDLSRDE